MASEDIKILNLILDKLISYHSADASGFKSEYEDDTASYWEDTPSNNFSLRRRRMHIRWKPKAYSWTPEAYDRDYDVSLDYEITAQTVSIDIDNEKHDVFLDSGSNNKDIKIKFVRLFHQIQKWLNEEIPRRQRESFIDATTKTFPDIFDHLLLEEDHGQDQEGDD